MLLLARYPAERQEGTLAVLGNLALAEDVAQGAFIAAYYTIAALREPAAFPG